MGTAKTCLLFFTIQLIYIISAQEMKRIPDGFVGTRGKKSNSDISSDVNHYYKRKPQFFVGVRGKKNLADILAEENFKRAPMGFIGMRGKKEGISPDFEYSGSSFIPKQDGSLIGKIDYAANGDFSDEATYSVNNLIAEYLQNLENDNILEHELKSAQIMNSQPMSEESETDVDKRAANVHQFYGVRGKKSIQNKRPYDLTFRGKFIGVRGKKFIKDDDSVEAIKFLLGQEGPWSKRKTQMGFFGMRGKKWADGEP